MSDADGNTEKRADTISVFNGPPPVIRTFSNQKDEAAAVAEWLSTRAKEGIAPHEFGVFVRSAAQLERARAAMQQAEMAFIMLDENVETTNGHVSISTMHLPAAIENRPPGGEDQK